MGESPVQVWRGTRRRTRIIAQRPRLYGPSRFGESTIVDPTLLVRGLTISLVVACCAASAEPVRIRVEEPRPHTVITAPEPIVTVRGFARGASGPPGPVDLILVLDQGSIIERGSHLELMSSGGLYSELYHTLVRGEAAPA